MLRFGLGPRGEKISRSPVFVSSSQTYSHSVTQAIELPLGRDKSDYIHKYTTTQLQLQARRFGPRDTGAVQWERRTWRTEMLSSSISISSISISSDWKQNTYQIIKLQLPNWNSNPFLLFPPKSAVHWAGWNFNLKKRIEVVSQWWNRSSLAAAAAALNTKLIDSEFVGKLWCPNSKIEPVYEKE